MKKAELERIYDILKREGEIEYGHTISRETLSGMFVTDPADFETWDYIDPLLALKDYLEQEHGMFCKTCQGNLLIGELNEAPYFCKKRRRRADGIEKRTKKVLENLNYRNMSSTARAEAMLEKRLLDMKMRNSRLLMRQIEIYEMPEEDEDNDEE